MKEKQNKKKITYEEDSRDFFLLLSAFFALALLKTLTKGHLESFTVCARI